MVVQQHRETSEAYAVARRQLHELAERTAGVLFRAAQVEDLELVYRQVADELRTVYSLAYEPSNAVRDGTWRRIQVKVNRPTAAVRTRRGYYAR
jgi:Ca-activated chloride channel family protein